MSLNLVNISYLGAAILFILSLGGLSHPQTAAKGNFYGVIGMALALIVTLIGTQDSFFDSPWFDRTRAGGLALPLVMGFGIGIYAALKVKMTEMPELVALMHSLVGLAAVLICFGTHLSSSFPLKSSGEEVVHRVEILLGIFIGAMTFSGSLIAFGKLSGKMNGKPLLLPFRHSFNLAMIVMGLGIGWYFIEASSGSLAGTQALIALSVLALVFGAHMVLAIGGADMPVVVSMLNSYSGWAASATGFMLSNDLLIITGALVGSSGAILSSIMCKAMNRKFLSVIAGGFGEPSHALGTRSGSTSEVAQGTVSAVSPGETARLLNQAQRVIIVPGYGMAVAQAQHIVQAITEHLMERGVTVEFAIHPVAGRMPGHMNVLLAEARVPYDIVYEMDEINASFSETDVAVVIGANDIVNPSAKEDPASPIAGMPVLEVWNAKVSIVMKRSMASGYAGVENPLFNRENNKMLFGDAKKMLEEVLAQLKNNP